MGQKAQKAWESTMMDDSLMKELTVPPKSGNCRWLPMHKQTRWQEETRFLVRITINMQETSKLNSFEDALQ